MSYHITSYSTQEQLPQEMLQLYKEAFPADERRSWDTSKDVTNFMDSHKDMYMSFIRDENNSFAGFIIYWNLTEKTIYVEHLATLPYLRGNGLGAMLISNLINTSGCRVLLEVEPPDNDISRRRIEFYRRQNMIIHNDLPYRQPPYSPDKQAIDLCIMSTSDISDHELSSKIIPRLHQLVYEV